MTYDDKEKPTHERILDAAFSFYSSPRFTNISLSEIALEAGITKTAIFRHFKNKDALFEAMQDRFFDDIASALVSVESPSEQIRLYFRLDLCKKALNQIIFAILKKREYICYMMYQYVSRSDFELFFFRELKKRNVHVLVNASAIKISDDGSRLIVKNVDRYFGILYVITSIVSFAGHEIEAHSFGIESVSCNTFAEKLSALLWNGIRESSSWVSEDRMKELDLLCSLENSALPPVNPLFSALSEVIRKKGFPGTTVESIAKELGLAKSSMYTYFSHKDELIVSLVGDEMVLLVEQIWKNSKKTENEAELGYITMRTEMEYFIARPAVLAVTGWLRIRGSFLPEQVYKKIGITDQECNKKISMKIDFPMTVKMYY